jgi:hypothetical protein
MLMGRIFFIRFVFCNFIHCKLHSFSTVNSHLCCIVQLPEHVKSYYKSWQDYHNEKVSVTLSNNAVSRIRQLLENSTGNLPMISALIPQPLAETIKSPSPHDHDDAVTLTNLNSGAWQIEKLLDTHRRHRLACSSVGYRYIQTNPASTPSQPSSSARSQKRKAEHPPEGDMAVTRKARRCMACESTQCPGRWKVDKCTVDRV